MATKEDVIKVIALMSNLPNCPADPVAAVEMHYLVLKDIDSNHLFAAAAQYLSTGTFFPTPGVLRTAALDLDLAAKGIPTAAEAWASVQDAKHYREAVYCSTGARLRQDSIKAELAGNSGLYMSILTEARQHETTCRDCQPYRTEYVYPHPIIEEVVNRLGGYDNLRTDNPAADRARFIDAYREIVERERKEASRLPEVARFIDGRRAELAAGQMKQLTERMTG